MVTSGFFHSQRKSIESKEKHENGSTTSQLATQNWRLDSRCKSYVKNNGLGRDPKKLLCSRISEDFIIGLSPEIHSGITTNYLDGGLRENHQSRWITSGVLL